MTKTAPNASPPSETPDKEHDRIQNRLRVLVNEALDNSDQTKSSIARKLGVGRGNMNRTYKSNVNMKINTFVSLLFHSGYRVKDITIEELPK